MASILRNKIDHVIIVVWSTSIANEIIVFLVDSRLLQNHGGSHGDDLHRHVRMSTFDLCHHIDHVLEQSIMSSMLEG